MISGFPAKVETNKSLAGDPAAKGEFLVAAMKKSCREDMKLRLES